MHTITALKTKDKVTFYGLQGIESDDFLEKIHFVNYIKIDDIILATTCEGKIRSALHTIHQGMEQDIQLSKEYLLMEFTPLVRKMLDIFNIDCYHGKKYINLKGDILIAQGNQLFWIDNYLNVYEISDYVSIGNMNEYVRLCLKNAEDKKEGIRSSYRLLMDNLHYDGNIYSIDTKELKQEVDNDIHC